MYVIFPTHVSTKEPICFHSFVMSQKKVRHYVTFHNTVESCELVYLVLKKFGPRKRRPAKVKEFDPGQAIFLL